MGPNLICRLPAPLSSPESLFGAPLSESGYRLADFREAGVEQLMGRSR